MRVTLKTLAILACLLYGVWLAILIKLIPAYRRRTGDIAARFHRRLLRILGIRVQLHGLPGESRMPRIIVGNHVSWLDILVLGSVAPTRFVSKAEVRKWPLAGWLATTVGTFYLQRGAGGTKHLIHELGAAVRSGQCCTFFPEGTTTDGKSTLRFQPRLFAVAIETGEAVQPIAFRYGFTQDGRDIAPFIGDDDMLSHLLRLMREPGLDVTLTFCDPIAPATGMDRATLALAAQNAVLAIIAPDQQTAAVDAAETADTVAA